MPDPYQPASEFLASLDADDFLYIHGRADDAINRGGFKITPGVIGDALKRHPLVGDVAVIVSVEEDVVAIVMVIVIVDTRTDTVMIVVVEVTVIVEEIVEVYIHMMLMMILMLLLVLISHTLLNLHTTKIM